MPDSMFDEHGRRHSRSLLKFGLAVVVIALAASAVFEYMRRGPVPQLEGFSEDYCLSLIAREFPDAQNAMFLSAYDQNSYRAKRSAVYSEDASVEIIVLGASDGSVAGCSAIASQAAGAKLAYENEYSCSYAEVRYIAEDRGAYLLTAVEQEFPTKLESEGAVVELPPLFVVEKTYMNPAQRAEWQNRAGALQRHEC